MFCPSVPDYLEPVTLGYDANNNLYSVSDLHCNNQNRLSHGYGYVWAAEVQQSKRYFQSNLKPTTLAAISYYDVQRWIDQKINAFRSTVSSMINSVVNGAKNALNSTINAVSNTARDAYNKATNLAYTLSSSVSSALSQAKSYADSAVRVAKSGLDYAINSVRSSASSAYNKAMEVANSVGYKVSNAISTAKSYADSAVNAAKSALNTTISAVKSTAADALSVAQSVGTRFGLFEMNFQRTLSEKFIFFTDFISGINTKINDVVQPLIKPFKDFAKGINTTVMNIINPVIKPLQDAFKSITTTVNNAVNAAVKPFNDFIKGFNDKINGFLKPIFDKINNLPKELLKQALQQAKDHFKGILDNFKSGIDTIKGTIDSIIRNINDLLAFRKETNARLSSLESRLNTLSNTYVTKVEFTTFKTDVDNRIRLLNNAVSSINTDLKAAFQSFNLSLIDLSNKIVSAVNSLNVNMGNLFKPVNDKLNSIISLISSINDSISEFKLYFDIFTSSFNFISRKLDYLIQTVKEIEIPKEENNTTINKEAETNIWDVAKEVLKTLQAFINNPAKILELVFDFLRSLIVPGNLDSLNALKTNFDSNVNRKFSFVGQFKHNFVDIYNSPRTFDDITINGSGLFSGSFTIPLSLINIFAPYVKALANGFLVLAFLQSCYVWYHKKFKLESSD